MASESMADSKRNLNSVIFMMFIEAVLKSLCNVYNVLIKKKNQASYRKICIAEAGMELFFSIC